VDSVFVAIDPERVSQETTEQGGSEIPSDRLLFPGCASALRANLEITRAVEKAGGTVLFGIESIDNKRRWQTVTLGISAGDSLIREILLVSRVR
jgi:hypothetical protein